MKNEDIKITDELCLTQLKPEQANELFKVTDENRDYLVEYLSWVNMVNTVDDSRHYIERSIEEKVKGNILSYGLKKSGEIVGTASIRNIKGENNTDPEIGYWISEKYAGQGLTTLAAKALTDIAIREIGLKKVLIRAHTPNKASNRVAEKIGYRFVNTVDDPEFGELNVWEYAVDDA